MCESHLFQCNCEINSISFFGVVPISNLFTCLCSSNKFYLTWFLFLHFNRRRWANNGWFMGPEGSYRRRLIVTSVFFSICYPLFFFIIIKWSIFHHQVDVNGGVACLMPEKILGKTRNRKENAIDLVLWQYFPWSCSRNYFHLFRVFEYFCLILSSMTGIV